MRERPFDLTARHALVTGAGGPQKIGFATAGLLSRLGARVSITSTTERIRDRAADLGDGTSVARARTDEPRRLAGSRKRA